MPIVGWLLSASIIRLVKRLLISAVLLTGLWVGSYRFIEPPLSAEAAGYALSKWQAGERLQFQQGSWAGKPPLPLVRALLAVEDPSFFDHHGLWRPAGPHKPIAPDEPATPTLTRRLAERLFLWQGGSWLHRGLSHYFTGLAELLLPKQRILMLYLNHRPFGDGLFGAAAALAENGHDPRALTERRALALMLQARAYDQEQRPDYVAGRALGRQQLALMYSGRIKHLRQASVAPRSDAATR